MPAPVKVSDHLLALAQDSVLVKMARIVQAADIQGELENHQAPSIVVIKLANPPNQPAGI